MATPQTPEQLETLRKARAAAKAKAAERRREKAAQEKAAKAALAEQERQEAAAAAAAKKQAAAEAAALRKQLAGASTQDHLETIVKIARERLEDPSTSASGVASLASTLMQALDKLTTHAPPPAASQQETALSEFEQRLKERDARRREAQ